jgi:carboxypeptidase PM20D1
MHPAAILVLVFLLFFLAVLLFRTALFSQPAEPVEPVSPIRVDKRLVGEHLAKAVQFETTSQTGPDPIERGSYQTVQIFLGLHRALQSMYPLTHRSLCPEIIQDFSLLYTWTGSDPSLKPMLLMAHLDVVPVEAGSEGAWSQPPYSGKIAEGFVWGRGTLDDKHNVIGILEAVEYLLRNGYKPRRTIYLAFGHDEEIGGMRGARRIASLLRGRKVELENVLDEGGAVCADLVPGVEKPVALVGIAEKGHLSLELCVECEGGHSSMPGAQTAIGTLSAAIQRLGSRPFPAHLDYILPMYKSLASEVPFSQRLFCANPWLFSFAIKRMLEKSPKMNAWMRSTAAPTIISGGVKDNILPRQARAVINCRIFPGDTVESVIEHVTQAIANPQVKIQPYSGGNRPQPDGKTPITAGSPSPSPATSFGYNPTTGTDARSAGFHQLDRTIRQVFPGVLVAPYLMTGASDARHYRELSANIFRFSPVLMDKTDFGRVHGVNERLSLDNCAKMVEFFVQWIKNNDEE